jgi:hypothetical protein
MTMKKQLSLVGFLLLIAVTVQAQTAKQYLLRMNEVYSTAKSLSMGVELLYFMGTNDVTPVQRMSGEMAKNGNSYYSSLMGKTTIVHNGLTLYVDEGQRLILYGKNETDKKKASPVELPDSTVYGQDAAYALGKGTATSARVIITPKDKSVYRLIEILINKQTFAMEEVVYRYTVEEDPAGSVQTVKVQYNNVQMNQPVPAAKFSTTKFVTRSKGKLVGVGNYASYEVIEQPLIKTPY